MIKMKKNVTPGETPTEITVSMIDQDLQDGISKPEMVIKYGIKPWEVDEMFKHPDLKGRRPARKRTLSFKFVDDTDTPEITGIPQGDTMSDTDDEDFVDPKQVTLDIAIDEAIKDVEEAKNQIQETQEAIVDMLSPTEFETPEETLLKAASTIDDPEFTPPSFEETMDLVKEQQEDELDMEDDTFEL